MYIDEIGGGPHIIYRIFFSMMVMLTCTLRTMVTEFRIPEFCYDNTIADIHLNGGDPTKIDIWIDMFSWSGLLEALGWNIMYGIIDDNDSDKKPNR